MTWNKPPHHIHDCQPAVRFWLAAHFGKATSTDEASWAVDLYAAFLDAAVVTTMMPVVTASAFGREMRLLAPKTPYMTKMIDGQRRSGFKYMVAPKDGVEVFSQTKTTRDHLQQLYKQAQERAGLAVAWESFERATEGDASKVKEFLSQAGIQATRRAGEERPIIELWKQWHGSHPDWTRYRFVGALGMLGRIKKDKTNKHQVVVVRKLEDSDAGGVT
jgi:hypothetical protein